MLEFDVRRATRLALGLAVSAFWSAPALADPPPTLDTPISTGPFARANPPDDPTGGAYTSPTLLFTPAAAVPTWNVRVITSLDMQGPTAPDRLSVGGTQSSGLSTLGFQPGLGGELGLPAGFTLGAGTNWVGGDPNTMPNAAGGLSPYFQLRYHILGRDDGRGFQLGSSVTYKFVGFGGNGPGTSQDPGEMEFAVSSQLRQRYYELGLQGVIGKDFATTDADAEIHAYAVVRPIPQLALGAASQVRIGLVNQPTDPPADAVAGAIASLTLGRWQLGLLGGESTIGLNDGSQVRVGGLGEVFGTARF